MTLHQFVFRRLVLALAAAALMIAPRTTVAQGVTTGAVDGFVLTEQGLGVAPGTARWSGRAAPSPFPTCGWAARTR
jgi:hypothetical protein